MSDEVLERISRRYNSIRYVGDCLRQIDFISDRKRKHLMDNAKTNGLDDFSVIKNRRRYCNADEFMDWVDRGFKSCTPHQE